jgi:hypothetical protein
VIDNICSFCVSPYNSQFGATDISCRHAVSGSHSDPRPLSLPTPTGCTRSNTTATGSGWNATATACGWSPVAATNWTDRYPWIVEAARKIRQKRFVLDGEAVILGVDGISDFNALHFPQA